MAEATDLTAHGGGDLLGRSRSVMVRLWHQVATRRSVVLAIAGPLLVGGAVAGFGQVLVSAAVFSSGAEFIWELSRHPLWIAVIAWWLTTWYQTRSKRSEFRFKTFERCAASQSELMKAGGEYYTAKALVAGLQAPGVQVRSTPSEVARRMETATAVMDEVVMRAQQLAHLNAVLFSEPTQRVWLEMLRRYTVVRFGDSLRRVGVALEEASDLWASFVEMAAREIPLPFTAVAMSTNELEREKKDTNEIIDRLEPRD